MVFEESLFLENPQHGADGRVAGRIGQLRHNLRCRGLATFVDDVHNLAFATAEICVPLFGHEATPFPLTHSTSFGSRSKLC